MITSAQENANHTPNEWDNWLSTSPGQYVLDWEEKQFGNAVEDAFGFDALQIGLPQLPCLADNRINHRWQMLLPSQTFINHLPIPQINVICQASIYDLPFENESLDLIALPHVLEFMENPHEGLREVHFNPISLWGLRQYSGKIFNQPFLPTDGQFIGHRRIKDWLNLLNYSIDRGRFGCYGIPIKKSMRLQGTTLLDKLGDRWWPFLGSVFMLSAIKRTPAKRLVGLIKNSRPILPSALKPATHSQSHPSQRDAHDH